MKKLAYFFMISVALGWLTGCVHAPNQLPKGAINSFDASSYETLMVAQATLNTLKQEAPAIDAQVPQFKAVLNQAIGDYNAAEQAWQTYHSTGGDSASVTAALAVLATDILKLEGLVPQGGGK